MFFNSFPFIFIFLPISIIIYFTLVKRHGLFGQIWLAIVSLIFYGLLTPEYLPLLLASIVFNYSIGSIIIKSLNDSALEKWIKPTLIIGVLGDVLLLGYYKYFNFVIFNLDRIPGLNIPMLEIIMPLGISFFTFTQLAYLADAYSGKVKSTTFISYLQFVTFFPHLIAGPIYHHSEIIPQFEDKNGYVVNWGNINLGILFFFFGLAKKVVIADNLALVATPIFSAVSNGGNPMFFEAWLGALAYTLQLYFDFSGYSDMAIGIALMFNIHFPLNFFSPYKVTSIIDFWRCWHITLSNWLRDYLYIPLGGNRYGIPIQMRNILITMLIGGLWHGAGWTFVIWGGLHGLFLVINHLWRMTGRKVHNFIGWLVTFIAVVIGWVFFRADSVHSALVILKGMAGGYGVSIPRYLPDLGLFANDGIIHVASVSGIDAVVGITIGLIIALCLPNLAELTKKNYGPMINKKQYHLNLFKIIDIPIVFVPSLKWSLLTAFVAISGIISLQTTSDFLYFQF